MVACYIDNDKSKYLNLLQTTGHFLYTLKMSDNQIFSDVSCEYRNEMLVWKFWSQTRTQSTSKVFTLPRQENKYVKKCVLDL